MTARSGAALLVTLVLLSCDEPNSVSSRTTLSLHVASAGGARATLDAAVVHVVGPTSRTVNAAPGSTVIIGGLRPGSYTVALQGMVAGAVEQFGQATGIQVAAGLNTAAPITLASFVPSVDPLPVIVVGYHFTVTFADVPHAVAYRVEAATDQAFTQNVVAVTRSSGQTSADVFAPASGTYWVRVRATDPHQGTGAWSAAQSVELQQSLAPGDLVITEIMVDPAAVPDANGEWFEIHNPTLATIDLLGLTVRDDGSDSFTIGSSVIVPPGGYVVLVRDGNPATNGGVTVDYVIPTTFVLANTDDEIVIMSGTTPIDRVAFGISVGFPPPGPGVALNLTQGANAGANDFPPNWCPATATYGAGDRGTPRSANRIC
ncbi:MAG TPA: lamin tail domain-containing protein [Gemmatimonadales bacterium]